MGKYVTKQRRLLNAFFEKHPDEQLSVQQIAAAPECRDISVSAIYRNLADLEEEGKVSKSSQSGSREVYYRYTAAHTCHGKLHLSCIRCKKTGHMNAPDAARLSAALQETDGFLLDRGETVLYGLCKNCR